MTEPRFVNYTSCCRLCLTDKYTSLSNIYDGNQDCDGLVEKISGFVGVEISIDDKLTTMLCEKCFDTIIHWDEYKKTCRFNQMKLHQLMENDNSTNVNIQIKEEPIDNLEKNDMNVDGPDDDVIIKPEPVDLDEDMEIESQSDMSTIIQGNTDDSIDTNENTASDITADINDQSKTVVRNRKDVGFRRCAVCLKQFSTSGNCRKHERMLHGFHRMLNPVISKVYSLFPTKENGEIHCNGKETPKEKINEKDKEKIEFAAGLCLQSKSTPQKQSGLTRVEEQYIEKCRVMITMFRTQTCVCHNTKYASLKKLLGHLRSLFNWLPCYTCYNCLLTFEGRSGQMRHNLRCPKVNLEYLVRLSEHKARSEDKIRLYQNFKCVHCNIIYGFYADYCEHVDKEHVVEGGPYSCICSQNYENPDNLRKHIHKSCYLQSFCDICYTLCETEQDFITHCEQNHDFDDNFMFMSQRSQQFTIMSNIEIANMLVELKTKEQEDLAPIDISNGEEAIAKVSDQVTIHAKDEISCNSCGKVYATYNNMLKHLKAVHGIDATPRINKNVCSVCDHEFSTYHNMLRHKALHAEELKKNKCTECPKSFRLNIELRNHMNTVHSSIPQLLAVNGVEANSTNNFHRCPDCGETFKNLDFLKEHKAKEHSFTCEECGKVLQNQTEYEHHRTMHLNIKLARDPETKNYHSVNKACKLCDKTFLTDEDLQNHLQNHDNGTVEDEEDVKDSKENIKKNLIACVPCNKVYQTERGLYFHNKKYHPKKRTNKGFPKPCDECGRMISTVPAYIMHKRKHAGLIVRHNRVGSNESPLSQNEESDYHTCKKCFKVFSSKYNLKQHMKCHGIIVCPTRLYTKVTKINKTIWCDICHQACQGTAELKKHKLEHRNEEMSELSVSPVPLDVKRLVYCKYCKLAYNNIPELNDHMENEHNETLDVKPKLIKLVKKVARFSCTLCNKKFNTASALNSHYGWHKRPNPPKVEIKTEDKLYKQFIPNPLNTQPRRFKCISCAESFDDDTTLQLHILEVHRNINATILLTKCKICNMEFKSQQEYELHAKLHKPKKVSIGVTCKICQKVFSRSDYLNIHIAKKHPQYAPIGSFKCPHCERLFEKQNALTIHLRVHEKAKEGTPAAPKTIVKIEEPSQTATKNFKYSCSICHIGFNVPKDLRNHIIAKHPF